ncbi:MAG: hypothetical protein AAF651_03145 [Cyanobacteria bacterium P01_C01_bin.73]
MFFSLQLFDFDASQGYDSSPVQPCTDDDAPQQPQPIHWSAQTSAETVWQLELLMRPC